LEQTVRVFKIGGRVIEQQDLLQKFLRDFRQLPEPKVLVHGGGRSATSIADRLNIPTRMIEGRRVTDEAMLNVVLMVYGGLVNKTMVAQLQAEGCNALGLTGADLNSLRSVKRPATPIDYGLVGDIQEVNASGLIGLMAQGIIPVMAPLTHDGQGQMLNTNADHIAGSVARALARHREVELYFCFEKKGVMQDPEDDASLIPLISYDEFQQLKEDGIVVEGMIPKLEDAFSSLKAGVSKVCIMHYQRISTVGRQIEGTTLCL